MANAPQPRRTRKAVIGSAVLGLIAAPAVVFGVTGTAQAAELTPYAEQVDADVAATEADLGAALDDLGLEAAE